MEVCNGLVGDGGVVEVEVLETGEFCQVGKMWVLEVVAVGEVEFFKFGHLGEVLKAFTGKALGMPEIEDLEIG